MDTTTLFPLRALTARLASLLITPAARAIVSTARALIPTAQAPWHTLTPGTALTLRAARGMRLQVEAGRLWLTEPGDPGDHFVAAGDSRALRGGARIVVECDGTAAARFRLLPPTSARGRRTVTGATPDSGTAHDLSSLSGLPSAAR